MRFVNPFLRLSRNAKIDPRLKVTSWNCFSDPFARGNAVGGSLLTLAIQRLHANANHVRYGRYQIFSEYFSCDEEELYSIKTL